MFEDPELPDFDSMSQEELIEWLEQLARSHGAAASEFIGDYAGDQEPPEANELSDEDDDWSDWLDDTAPGAAAGDAGDRFVTEAGLVSRDADPPVDLSLFADEDTAPTASLDWLDEIIAAQNSVELPDSSKTQAPAKPVGNPHEMPSQDDDDPLDWLSELDSNGIASSAASQPAHELGNPDDFDETWEDDETLDDLEDESLYARDDDRTSTFLESLRDLEDREAEKHSTQSMPPLPDSLPANSSEPVEAGALASADRPDSLTRAFLIQEQDADLEAWYAERLRAVSGSSPAVAQPAIEQPAPIKPGKPPPPGLKAAIYSARQKVKSDSLSEALVDYETLLGTAAGLAWVVHDMRELIAQAPYRDSPAVHRVLGDALMRQGYLDAALNVYRHALTLL